MKKELNFQKKDFVPIYGMFNRYYRNETVFPFRAGLAEEANYDNIVEIAKMSAFSLYHLGSALIALYSIPYLL